jgi:hypothetical protein
MHCQVYLQKHIPKLFLSHSLKSTFLYRCWPLCLIPFILHPNQIVNLHCCQCSYYFGTYDTRKCQLIHRSSPPESSENIWSECSEISWSKSSEYICQNVRAHNEDKWEAPDFEHWQGASITANPSG